MTTPRVFELRTYLATPGKLTALEDRFRDHTLALFDKHGFEVIGFWISQDHAGEPTEELVYLLGFDSREAADAAWTAFRDDPAWIEAKAQSEKNGSLTVSVESKFITPTGYSPLT